MKKVVYVALIATALSSTNVSAFGWNPMTGMASPFGGNMMPWNGGFSPMSSMSPMGGSGMNPWGGSMPFGFNNSFGNSMPWNMNNGMGNGMNNGWGNGMSMPFGNNNFPMPWNGNMGNWGGNSFPFFGNNNRYPASAYPYNTFPYGNLQTAPQLPPQLYVPGSTLPVMPQR